MAALMPLGKQQYFAASGAPLVGGKVYTYAAGTTSPLSTYSDKAGVTPNTNPVILDSRGEATIFWGSAGYKVVLKDSADVTVWTQDNLYASLDATSTTSASLITYTPAGTGAVATTVQTKLRESVSVKDFGAKGDGVTDDTAAIQLAATAAVEILFPVGTYLINSSPTISAATTLKFVSGATIKVANGVTFTLNNLQLIAGRQTIFNCVGTGKVAGTISNDLIFPEWWGAIADGLPADFPTRAANGARNTPAIQAALTFAGNKYAASGLTGTVSLTWGYYITNATLSIPLSVNLTGYGIGSAIFYYAGTGNAIEMVSTNNSLVSDIFIAPLASATWNYSTGYGLYINGVSTPIVRNVWSSGFGAGTFYIQSAVEGRFYGLISDNSNGPAFTIRGVGQGSVFENCVTAGNAAACFDISGYDWVFLGCTAKDGTLGTYGFYLNVCEDINLIGCQAYSTNRDGFLLTSSALNCNLTNCTANDPSNAASGVYNGFNISGFRNKLTGCKTTANAPMYGYGLFYGGGATDCSSVNDNYISGTLGIVGDFQPTGNNTYQVQKVTTSSATPLAIWSKGMNNNTTCILEATVVGNQRGSTARAVYKFWALCKTDATSTAFVSGPTVIYSFESNAALDATFVVTTATANAGVISLQVTGLAGNPMDWEATVSVIGVTG